MATTTTPAQPQVQHHDDAYGVLYNEIYAPAFFEKLATDFGVQPQSQEEASGMLKMAAQLRAVYDDQQEKAASANGSLLQWAQTHLHGQLTNLGYAQPAVDNSIKQAAARGATIPSIANAVLSLEIAAAQQQQ